MPVSEIANSQNNSAGRSARILTTDLLDFEVLKAFERVKSDDGSDILIELIDLYIEGTSHRIAAMRKAVDERDWDKLKGAAHTLKGSSSTLGLRQIAMACQDLEAASASSPDDVPMLMRLLESRFLEVRPVRIAERNQRLMSRTGEHNF